MRDLQAWWGGLCRQLDVPSKSPAPLISHGSELYVEQDPFERYWDTKSKHENSGDCIPVMNGKESCELSDLSHGKTSNCLYIHHEISSGIPVDETTLEKSKERMANEMTVKVMKTRKMRRTTTTVVKSLWISLEAVWPVKACTLER